MAYTLNKRNDIISHKKLYYLIRIIQPMNRRIQLIDGLSTLKNSNNLSE